MAELLSKEQIIKMEEEMVAFGPRFTGCKTHENWIDYLQGKMRDLGYDVKEYEETFKRWEPKDCGLHRSY